MTETAVIDTWLYQVLSGDATLTTLVGSRIYSDLAPESAGYPLVVYQMQAGRDRVALGAARIWSSCLYLVRAIGRTTSYADLEPIAARIDALLDAQAAGQVYACVREEPFKMAEVTDKVEYRHLGGLYRILAR